MLGEAEKLCYSKVTISRLKRFFVDDWNEDSVTIDDIREMQAIEKYVRKNTPAWKKSVFSRIGDFVNDEE